MKMFIEEHRGQYGVEPICRVLPNAPSTYRAHAAGQADPTKLCDRARRDAELRPEIQRVRDENFQVCGVRKVWRQFSREGIAVARRTVSRGARFPDWCPTWGWPVSCVERHGKQRFPIRPRPAPRTA
jgi:hypothetical protein